MGRGSGCRSCLRSGGSFHKRDVCEVNREALAGAFFAEGIAFLDAEARVGTGLPACEVVGHSVDVTFKRNAAVAVCPLAPQVQRELQVREIFLIQSDTSVDQTISCIHEHRRHSPMQPIDIRSLGPRHHYLRFLLPCSRYDC